MKLGTVFPIITYGLYWVKLEDVTSKAATLGEAGLKTIAVIVATFVPSKLLNEAKSTAVGVTRIVVFNGTTLAIPVALYPIPVMFVYALVLSF